MKAEWIDTYQYYQNILLEPDLQEKRRLYKQFFIEPWLQMMEAVAPMFQADIASDKIAVARAWGWLLPEDLVEKPAVLQMLEAADAWMSCSQALIEGVRRFEPYSSQIPLNTVTGWLVAANSDRSDPAAGGYTGAADWFQPRFVVQVDRPDDYSLPRLPGAVIHELHHLIRGRLYPQDFTRETRVADYIITEGLAESYATSILGEQVAGFYVTDFDESQIGTAKMLVKDGLQRTGVDVIRGYIFGDALASFHHQQIGMPRYGGYAIGFRVVQAFLQQTGQSVEKTTFMTADDIIEGSRFFK